MRKINDIDKTIDKVSALTKDIKAEVVVGDLLSNEVISEEEYLISKLGQFRRAYSHDIETVDPIDFNLDTIQSLNFLLNRDGMYDMLPEIIFHAQRSNSIDKEVHQMVNEYHKIRDQKKHAQEFFRPFENEFFDYSIAVEKFESDYFKEINSNTSHPIFYEFWGIAKDLHKDLVAKYIKILPYSYKIIGNLDLTIETLSYLLNEKVSYMKKTEKLQCDENEGIRLGEVSLAVDFITGDNYMDYSIQIEVNIGELENTSYRQYILDGAYKKFLDLFYEQFFPMETEIKTNILLPKKDEEFRIEEDFSILGYSSVI